MYILSFSVISVKIFLLILLNDTVYVLFSVYTKVVFVESLR